MMDDKPKVDVVDTTDCLEAIGAFKAMKNFFFMLTFICLIVLQGVFWLNYLGYIDASEASGAPAKVAASVAIVDTIVVTNDVKFKADATAQDVKSDATIEKKAEKVVSGLSGDAPDAATTEEAAAPVEEGAEDSSLGGLAKYIPKYQHACIAIRLCNFVLVITATTYCLILLMTLKVSLVGRLGGISHISRAFFLSLFALVILLPWQGLFEGIVLGAVYVPDELFTKLVLTDESTLVCKILYFARFTGMWAVSLLLLLAAQARSAKWSKTTLRRLGILR